MAELPEIDLRGLIERVSGGNTYKARKKREDDTEDRLENDKKRFAAALANIRDDDPQRQALKKAAYSGGTMFGNWAMKKWKNRNNPEGSKESVDSQGPTAEDKDTYDKTKALIKSGADVSLDTKRGMFELAPYYESNDAFQNSLDDDISLSTYGKVKFNGETKQFEPVPSEEQVFGLQILERDAITKGYGNQAIRIGDEIRKRIEEEQARVAAEAAAVVNNTAVNATGNGANSGGANSGGANSGGAEVKGPNLTLIDNKKKEEGLLSTITGWF
jgi:hypothetical protein|tara:strand:- start:4004 stop:4822 length:819 start_codon:yes stop_codon:yes gene_type:complete